MFILQGIISGLLATIIFDIYQISLAYSYNVNKSKWNSNKKCANSIKK